MVGRIFGDDETTDGPSIRASSEIVEVISHHQDAVSRHLPLLTDVHDAISTGLAEMVSVFACEDGVKGRSLEVLLFGFPVEDFQEDVDTSLVVASDDGKGQVEAVLELVEEFETALLQLEVPASFFLDLDDGLESFGPSLFALDLLDVFQDVHAHRCSNSVGIVVLV